ncbi:SgcJ/EcaC family oxidoreductase [Rufibacter soli]
MKKMLLTGCVCLLCLTGFAQHREKDQTAINAQIDAMIADWNRHNFDKMETYTTPDFDWVNIVGMWWKGQKENRHGLEAYHKTFFKNTPQTKTKTHIRFLTDDVALVHLLWGVGAFYPPDGVDNGHNKMGDDEELATLVMVKQKGKWLITAGHNIVIDPFAAKNNPVLYMSKE